ncbi:MAG: hypothetical protein ACLFVN_04930 [Phycisphaeraceae bacterium]
MPPQTPATAPARRNRSTAWTDRTPKPPCQAAAEAIPRPARLLPATLAWLACYERRVCRHRLAVMANAVTDPSTSAGLGLLLDLARTQSGSTHFNAAIAACRPLAPARPEAGDSEAGLARRLGVTRRALRDALEHLELCGLISRQPGNAGTRTTLQRDQLAA